MRMLNNTLLFMQFITASKVKERSLQKRPVDDSFNLTSGTCNPCHEEFLEEKFRNFLLYFNYRNGANNKIFTFKDYNFTFKITLYNSFW